MQRLFRQNIFQNQGRIHYHSVPRSPLLPTFPSKQLERPTKFHKGQEAAFAFNDYYQYPEDYRPWTLNYKGDGFLFFSLGVAYFGYFTYEQYWLQKCEYEERPEGRQYYIP